MIKISHNQASDRFDSLPDSLKEAGLSAVNTAIIQGICDNNHLTLDKFSTVSKLIGYVLFGFIHPEDLAKEIRAELNIAPEIANSIAAEIDRKIFAPVRADLEKNYAPPVPEVTRVPAETAVSPESIIDLKQKVAEAVPAPAEIPTTPEIEAEPQKVVAKESKTAEEPAPVIIHKETEYKPTTGEAAKRSLGGIFGLLTPKEKPTEARPVTARIEMTGVLKPKPEEGILKPAPTVKPEPPQIRVVHYTELRTPFSPLDTTRDKPVETPAKPPVSAPTPPIIAPAQPQKEEIKKEVSSPGVRRTETPAVDLRQSKIEPSVPPIGVVQGKPLDLTQGKPTEPVKMSEPLKILEPQKVADSLRPLETPKPFEPLRKPEPIKPFEPVKSVESVKPPEPPKPPQPPKTEEKKPEKPFGAAPASDRASADKQDKPGDEGDIIDLRTFEKIKGFTQKSEPKGE